MVIRATGRENEKQGVWRFGSNQMTCKDTNIAESMRFRGLNGCHSAGLLDTGKANKGAGQKEPNPSICNTIGMYISNTISLQQIGIVAITHTSCTIRRACKQAFLLPTQTNNGKPVNGPLHGRSDIIRRVRIHRASYGTFPFLSIRTSKQEEQKGRRR